MNLSIILPAYNEAQRLPKALESLFSFIRRHGYDAEIIVVENGSTDDTAAVARGYVSIFPGLRVLQEPQAGKGRAVRRGMLESAGDYRMFCDVDFSMPVEQINTFWARRRDADILIASRELPRSTRHGEPLLRHFTGRVFNDLVQAFVLPGFRDSQCGFKMFTRRAALDLFGCQTLNGWTFDVELLYIAHLLRLYRIVEVPIDWYHNPDSRVHMLRDALAMVRDILTIRQNAERGLYGGIMVTNAGLRRTPGDTNRW